MALDDLSLVAAPGPAVAPVAGRPSVGSAGAEWTAASLRPVAHWVVMPGERGRGRLSMVWETPDPMPPTSD